MLLKKYFLRGGIYNRNTTSYDSLTKTLTFSGSGELDWTIVDTPYSNYTADEEINVVIKGYSSIKESTFANKTKLKSVKIGSSVETIGEYAFHDCSNLKSVTIGNHVESIPYHAFYECHNLTSVEIPNSVTEICGSAFSSCYSLTSVEIPESVTEIGASVFDECRSLTSVTFKGTVGGSGLTYIDPDFPELGSLEIDLFMNVGTQGGSSNPTIKLPCSWPTNRGRSDGYFRGGYFRELPRTLTYSVGTGENTKIAKVSFAVSPSKTTPVASDFDYKAPTTTDWAAGTTVSASVAAKSSVTGMGTVTVKYYSDSACTTEVTPNAAGTYYVAVDVAEGDSYLAGTNITADSWKFTLENHTHTYATTWSKDATYHWHAATCAHTSEISDKAAHTWNSGAVTTEPTTTSTGVRTYTCTVCVQTKTETINKTANAISLNAGLKVSQTNKALTVKWGKVAGADGYLVYATYCGTTFPTKAVATTKKTSVSITKLNGKKLDLKKNYKVYIKAYKVVDGKKVILGKTITAHVVGKNNTKYTNAKSIKLTSKSSIMLKVGKTSKIKASVVLVYKKKRPLSDAHTATLRYATTNVKVATVSTNGKIKAVGKGTCYVYGKQFTERFGSLTCRELRPGGFKEDDPPHLCEQLTCESIYFTYCYLKDWMNKGTECDRIHG